GPRVRAAPVDLVFLPGQGGAARRARGGELELALGAGAQVGHRPEHLGDHVAGLAQDHHVADEDALALDLVRVVQGGPVYCRPAYPDRLHHGERSDPAGTPDVHPDIEQPSGDLLRRVLVGDSPPGRAAGRAELPLLRDLVHLHHHAVDLVRRVVPVLGVVIDVLADPGHVGHDLVQAADRQAPAAQPLVPAGLRVGRALQVPFLPWSFRGADYAGFAGGAADAIVVFVAFDAADAVHDGVQGAGRGDPGVLLPQRPGRGVPRVGE